MTWRLREGHEAPDGWSPVELRKTAQANAQNDKDASEALSPAPEPQTSPEPKERSQEQPETPAELLPLWEDLLAHVEPLMRPGSFQAWIELLALVAIDGANRLILQAPDGFHAQWVSRQFAQPLRRVTRALDYEDFVITWQPQRQIRRT